MLLSSKRRTLFRFHQFFYWCPFSVPGSSHPALLRCACPITRPIPMSLHHLKPSLTLTLPRSLHYMLSAHFQVPVQKALPQRSLSESLGLGLVSVYMPLYNHMSSLYNTFSLMWLLNFVPICHKTLKTMEAESGSVSLNLYIPQDLAWYVAYHMYSKDMLN